VASVTAADWQQGHKTRLKLAFCLYKYMPYGGLQRDFLRIALECQRMGHDIRVYTLSWQGEIPTGFEVVIVPVTAFTNHTRYQRFSAWVQYRLIQDPVDAVIGINKMPGLDVYYAADSCYEEKAHSQRSWLYRLLPRYHHFSRYERAVFGRDSATEILMISDVQKPFFDRYYQTPSERLSFLPPGIARDRIAPADVEERRRDMRLELGIADDEKMLLMLGSGFIKKGLKRALHAVRSLPREQRLKTRFFVVGEDNPKPFLRLIWFLGMGKQVTILSGRDDAERFLFAADLMILPALDEAAGIVLLEAIVAGCPVLATENCGYGHYVAESGMGSLVPMPFRQQTLNQMLSEMLAKDARREWADRSRAFAKSADIYSLPVHAARKIEEVALSRLDREAESRGTIAYCLFKYFPFGGLQRDFLRIASETLLRGFRIRIYTLMWQGDVPPGFEVIIVPVKALTNHSRNRKFHRWVADHIAHWPVDTVVGFNKMPDLDVYYAADSCYEDKAQTQRGFLYRKMPRYLHFSGFERAVFGADSDTEILMISPVQVPLFQKYYQTPEQRIHLLSPGIARDRIAPPNRDEIRAEFRREMGLADRDLLLLMVGSGFITKGLDRTLIAISALPDELRSRTKLFVIGQDSQRSFKRMAARLGISEQVTIFKGREDIPRFLMGADILVHPAYVENTGTVLLEAIVAGLPVVATDICGYAPYIEEANAGRLVPSPFHQETFNQILQSMMRSEELSAWSGNGMQFAQTADIYNMPLQAADFICAADS
jgi:UDP-glucose:(heptosyl)LPS alpha-1,3-glucosyltransferase